MMDWLLIVVIDEEEEMIDTSIKKPKMSIRQMRDQHMEGNDDQESISRSEYSKQPVHEESKEVESISSYHNI